MNIYLTGMMGAGKSTIGKKLARKLHFNFVDLDELIEQKEGLPVTEIFNFRGEKYFRELESAVLKETANLTDTVIATGGGTPCYFDNQVWMNNHGRTIYLRGNISLLAQRLLPGMAKRPLLSAVKPDELPGFLSVLVAAREPFYSRSHIIADLPVKNLLSLARQAVEAIV